MQVEHQNWYDLAIVECSMTDRADEMFVENGTAIDFRFFAVSEYH